MKWLVCLMMFLSGAMVIKAQSELACLPDSSILDTIDVVYPTPFTDSLGGGITVPACINEEYSLLFTMVIPNTVIFNGITVGLTYAQIDTVGAVDNLPIGIEYDCNPSNCRVLPGVPSCILLHGIPSEENDTGIYDFVINLKLATIIGIFEETIPGTVVPGKYSLPLMNEGSCTTANQKNLQPPVSNIKNVPNPFRGKTDIWVYSERSERVNIRITDMMGRTVKWFQENLRSGMNIVPFYVESLSPGVYTYQIIANNYQVSKKMQIGY